MVTPLQRMLKLVFGRTKLVDEKASISDYLFTLPTRQSSVLSMRQNILQFLLEPTCVEDISAFKSGAVAILRDAR